MGDPRVDAVARILVDYSVKIQQGEFVRVRGSYEGSPLLRAVFKRVLERGGHPWLQIGLDGTDEIFYKNASDEQLTYVSKICPLTYNNNAPFMLF